MTNWDYDTREPLKSTEFPDSDQRIGVVASEPFHHIGLNAEYVDVSRETVVVTSRSYGNCYPAETKGEEIRRATEQTIADLDRVIAELTEHRDRLAAGIDLIARGGS